MYHPPWRLLDRPRRTASKQPSVRHTTGGCTADVLQAAGCQGCCVRPRLGLALDAEVAVACDSRLRMSDQGLCRESLLHVARYAGSVKRVPCIHSAHRRTAGDRLSRRRHDVILSFFSHGPCALVSSRKDPGPRPLRSNGSLTVKLRWIAMISDVLTTSTSSSLSGHFLRSFSARFCCYSHIHNFASPLPRLFLTSQRRAGSPPFHPSVPVASCEVTLL